MGAAGTAKVGQVLRNEHGHRPVELERYAMANKVWQTKVKRLRLPDLVCLQCGLRVESRAKSKLGIILSHSERPGRRWNEGGMRPQDLYAFAHADPARDIPVVGKPVFFTAAALNASVTRAKLSAPKAASEGSEMTMSWACWVAERAGVFQGVDSENRLVCRWDGGKFTRYWQWDRWGDQRFVYVRPEEVLVAGETMIAGIVAPAPSLACPGRTWDVAAALGASDQAERYAAVKAVGIEGRADLAEELMSIESRETDWRIKLEALVSLARLDPERWTSRIGQRANAFIDSDEARMEAVFALSEVPTDEAAQALAAVANDAANPTELRSAAAWGLGRGAKPRPDLLLPLTADEDPLISLHAIVGLQTLPDELVPQLVRRLGAGDDRGAASAACLLSRHRRVEALLDAARGHGEARLWALGALGELPPDQVQAAGGELEAEMVRTLEPLWHAQRNWLRRDQGRDGLEALEVQTVRFDPVDLTA
jgi:hypothetical protein